MSVFEKVKNGGPVDMMTQKERLDYLAEEFKKDPVRYRDLETPQDTEGKRRILTLKAVRSRDASFRPVGKGE